MSLEVSDTVDLLSYKLSDLMSELYTINRGEQFIKDEQDEPWSSDMSGPHKYAVWNNDTFVISEVANAELASAIAGGRDPVDAGENIKLYGRKLSPYLTTLLNSTVNDVTTRKKLTNWGVSPAAIRAYIRSGICASSWIVEAGANYILRTANDGKDANVAEYSEGEDPRFVQYLEQRNAMMDVFLRLAKFEQIGFGPGSSEESHATLTKVTSSQAQDTLVTDLFLEVIDKYRKKREEAHSSSMVEADKDEIRKETDLKGQAAKQKKNQKKYARKKAKRHKETNVMSKEARDDTQIVEVEVEEGDLDGVDAAQFDACRDLWRQIMDKTPSKVNAEGKASEEETVEAKVDEQETHRPGTLDAQPAVSWKEAGRDFRDMMAQYGLDHIEFVGDKLKSGVTEEGDGLEPFFGLPMGAWRH